MPEALSTRFTSPVRAAIEAFANAGGALPGSPSHHPDRPGAATTQRVAPQHAEFIPYGPRDDDGNASCEIMATLGEIEIEYAAIRRNAAVFDAPHRGSLIISGSERRDFLNRMLTQDLRQLHAGHACEAFWLNRKGRIEADLLIAELGEHILIDLDATTAATTASSLDSFVFSEDVQVRNATHELHRIQLHGPHALAIAQHALGAPFPPPAEVAESPRETSGKDVGEAPPTLQNFRAAQLTFNNEPVHIIRRDVAGTTGLHLFVPRAHAEALWRALVHSEHDSMRARAIGWYAFNIARIEAGTPMFNIDFGPTNLPHETGLVDERVSFKKGCYIGQEIVARMQNLGAPKQKLTGLRMLSDHLPVAGAAVFEIVDDKPGDRVGVVTSSTLSPMCSAQPVAFAMLRTQFTEPGASVIVHAEGEEARGQAHPLTFWAGEGARP